MAKKTPTTQEDKKVWVLRTCKADMTAYNGFKWPESGPVECPDWKPTAACGNGLHGLLWGFGDYSLLAKEDDAKWLIVEVDESKIVTIGQKVKFPTGNVIYCGDAANAICKIASEAIVRDATPKTGYYSRNASSGYYSQNASSGDSSQNASSGNYSRNASSGDSSQNASSGNYSQNASSGDYSRNASSGYYSRNASSGDYSQNASSGDSSQNASSGNYSQNASSGDSSQNASSGYYSQNASSGDSSQNASSGNYSRNASSGDSSQNASSGNYSRNEAKGANSTCACAGLHSLAKVSKGGAIALAYELPDKTMAFACGSESQGEIKADTWYIVKDGKLTEA